MEAGSYNGMNSTNNPKDIDSNPFNHDGADIEDDESSLITAAAAVIGDSLIRLGFFDDRTELLVVFSTVDNSSICFRFWAK